MDAMNTLDRTPKTPFEYRPILKARDDERPATQWETAECACPELCQVDHDN